MGHHFSVPSLPSPAEIVASVSHTVKSGVATAIKDLSKSLSFVSHNMPVDTFLKLPLMADIMQFKGVDIIGALAGNFPTRADQYFITSVASCWAKDVPYAGKQLEGHVQMMSGYLYLMAGGFSGDMSAFNFALLATHPIVRAPLMTYIAYGRGTAKMLAKYSPFTKFFAEELMKVETLVADLIPLWANLGK